MPIIEKGQRRLFVIAAGLASIILLGILALFASPHAATVLLAAVGAVGTIISFYFHADGKIKSSQQNTP